MGRPRELQDPRPVRFYLEPRHLAYLGKLQEAGALRGRAEALRVLLDRLIEGRRPTG